MCIYIYICIYIYTQYFPLYIYIYMLWTPQPMLRLCMLPSTAPRWDLPPSPPVAGSAPTQPIGGGWRDGGRDQYLNHIYDQLARRFVPKRHRDSTNWTMNWTTWKHVLPGVEKMTKDDSCTCCLIGFKVGTISYIYISIYLFGLELCAKCGNHSYPLPRNHEWPLNIIGNH